MPPIFLQVEGVSQWLFKQAPYFVLLVLAIVVLARYFTKRDEKKDAELRIERAKHEENLKDQIEKGEDRLDKFDEALARRDEIIDKALERRDAVSRETAQNVRVVGENLRELTAEIRSKRKV